MERAPAGDAEELIVQVDRLRRACAGWSTRRWSAEPLPAAGLSTAALSAGDGATKADVAYDLVQRLADLGADAEGRARRPVPRLADPVLLDQVRTLAHDVRQTGDQAAVRTALELLRRTRPAIDGSRPG